MANGWTRTTTNIHLPSQKIDWFRLSDLPTWSKDANSGGKKKGSSARTKGELANGKQAKFYMVTPFISCVCTNRNSAQAAMGANSGPRADI